MSKQIGGKLPTVTDMVEQEYNLKPMKLPRDNNDGYFYKPSNFFAHYKNPLINPYFNLIDFPSKQIDTSGNYNTELSLPQQVQTLSQSENDELNKYMTPPDFFTQGITKENVDKKIFKKDNFAILHYNKKKHINFGKRETKKGGSPSFALKKKFYDIFTDYYSRDLNMNKQELIYSFQKLVIDKFQYYINLYRLKHNIPENDMFFHYKGGTTLKIIYEKYKEQYSNIKIPNIDKFFSRSDSDYQVNIKQTTPNFNLHYYNLNIILYNLFIELNNYLDNNLGKYFKFNEVLNQSELNKLLQQSNNLLQKIKSEPKTKDTIPYHSIVEFFGIQLYDHFYYNNKGQIQYIQNKTISNNDVSPLKVDINIHDIIPSSSKHQFEKFTDLNSDVSKRLINSFNKSFYITVNNKDEGIYTSINSNKYTFYYLEQLMVK